MAMARWVLEAGWVGLGWEGFVVLCAAENRAGPFRKKL